MLIELIILVLVAIRQSHGEDQEYDRTSGKNGYKTGRFQIFNKSFNDLFIIKVSHLISNDAGNGHGTTIYNVKIKPRNVSDVYEFDYENGWAAGFDYWYISATINGYDWNTKSNFYCNISKEDNGIVVLIVDMDSENLEVVPSSSSSCVTRLSSVRVNFPKRQAEVPIGS